MRVRFLNQADVRRLLDLDRLIDALAGAFVELSAGRASVPPRVAAFAPGGFLGAMPGYVGGVLEAKLVSVFPRNGGRGVPTHQALIVLFDEETGTPACMMDGTHVTAVRTAAASALATRVLAREDARVLAVLGAGVQARSHLEAVTRVRRFSEVRVASRTRTRADALAEAFGVRAVASFEEAVGGADVVCSCTDSPRPVLRRDWLAPGAHVTSVGAAREGPELDPETVTAGVLAVESRVAFEPYPAGAHELQGLDPSAAVELGELLAGTRQGRSSPDEVTVYKSTGHAVEDAAAARLVYERALAAGVGAELEL
ncbi:MAG: ornithine cyclodeaminase family protein [Thermoleophilia bacterium]|nr:ornithine cyclodeaminase family protein [Thermoleophilia bacterium]